MSHETTATEARHALSSIDHRRQQVIAEIDVPRWYWVSVATGWVALGVLAQYGATWAFVAGTLAFGQCTPPLLRGFSPVDTLRPH